MINKQKKLAITIIIVIMLVIGTIAYVYLNNKPENPNACTMEAKQCPDGSYVGRSGPRCEFNKCPQATEEMDLVLYIQNKEVAATRDCSVTQKVIYRVPKTVAIANASLKILFSGELSKYGVYRSVNIVDGVARVILENDLTSQGLPISSLSSCENSHLLSVLKDTLTQYQNIKSVELFSPQGNIQF